MERFAVCVLIVLTGCVSDVANRYYVSEHYPPKPVEQVAVLHAEPARPYTLIADFQSRGDDDEGMRYKAADIGADAVIVTYIGGGHNGNAEWAGTSGDNTASHTVGSAIRYKDDK